MMGGQRQRKTYQNKIDRTGNSNLHCPRALIGVEWFLGTAAGVAVSSAGGIFNFGGAAVGASPLTSRYE